MNLFERSNAWLERALGNAAGVEITYTRGIDSVVIEDVEVGRTAFASNMHNAARLEFSERDYLIPAASLILGGQAVTPRKGDRIAEVVAGELLTFELMTPATGEPAWRYSDPERTFLRVHVKRVQ